MYVECSAMFTETSPPGTNVAAKTRLVRNDSHQNWRRSQLVQLIEASVCVFFLMNLCPLCPPSHTVVDLPQSPAHMQTHAFIISDAGKRLSSGKQRFTLTPGSQRSTKKETGRWRAMERFHIYVQYEVEDGG